jgi:hypothetical protein
MIQKKAIKRDVFQLEYIFTGDSKYENQKNKGSHL